VFDSSFSNVRRGRKGGRRGEGGGGGSRRRFVIDFLVFK
jgi:hypothetical protein